MTYKSLLALFVLLKFCQGIVHVNKVRWFENFDLTPQLDNHLSNVYYSEDPKFTYYDPGYARLFPGFKHEFQFLNNVSVRTLLHRDDGQSEKCCYYYSGDVSNSPFRSLGSSVSISRIFRNVKNVEVNIWITQSHLTATLHSDAVNNLFIQLHGSKKVILYPPRFVSELYIHGRLQPHACQSRLDQYCASSSRHPITSTSRSANSRADYCAAPSDNTASPTILEIDNHVNITPYSIVLQRHSAEVFDGCWDVGDGIHVDLHAGDVLVIPPFWFHKTFSDSASVSLSLWWETHESKVFDDMLAHPLPFESDWSAAVLAQAALHFITHLLQQASELVVALTPPPLAMSGGDRISLEVKTLLSQRYWEDIKKFAGCISADGSSSDQTSTSGSDGGSGSGHNGDELKHCSFLQELLSRDSARVTMDEKIAVYAGKVASIAVEGLVGAALKDYNAPGAHHVDATENTDEDDLKLLQQHIIRTYGIRLDTDDDDDEDITTRLPVTSGRVENQQAVLCMKLCDYIEEVLFTVASLVHPEGAHSDKVRQVVALLHLYLRDI